MTTVGFTGSRRGMTPKQRMVFTKTIKHLAPTLFVHGDCLGADEQAHEIVRAETGARIRIRPTHFSRLRAHCEGDEVLPTRPPLDRNQDIVDDCEVLVATPASVQEVSRSGTWATIRRGWKAEKRVIIVFPDGSIGEGASQ